MALDYSQIPINATRGGIRLLSLLPRETAQDSDENSAPRVRCLLTIACLDDLPVFLALSYHWGDENDRKQAWIDIDVPDRDAAAASPRTRKTPSQSISITSSLESALFHLSDPNKTIVLWADALCINQEDVPEKNAQVQLMKRIYEAAERVILWQGPAADDSDVAIEAMRVLGEEGEANGVLAYFPAHSNMPEEPPEYVQMKTYLAGKVDEAIESFPFRAVQELVVRPWWRRVWVVQEMALGQDVTLVCGYSSIPLKKFTTALLTLAFVKMAMAGLIGEPLTEVQEDSKWQKRIEVLNEINNYKVGTSNHMCGLRRRYQRENGRTPPTLLSLLYSTHLADEEEDNFLASNSKDHIYGFLGLASDAASLAIVPNYSTEWSVQDMYTDSARRLLEHGNSDLLLLCQFPKKIANLPSWVPDWTSDIRKPCGSLKEKGDYMACGQTAFEVVQMISHPTLPAISVKGVLVDEIEEVGAQWLPEGVHTIEAWDAISAITNDIERFCIHSNTLNNNIYLRSEQRETAHASILTEDLIRNEASAIVRSSKVDADLGVLYELMKLLISKGEITSFISQFWIRYRTVIEVMFKRRPLISKLGYVGFAPAHTHPGDFITIMFGVHVPFVLRKRDNDYYELVGPTYVHGIMDGEFLEQGSLKEMTITMV